MSRRHNVKHFRTKSNYRKRLEARGLTRTPEMRDYLGLGKRHARDEQNQGRRP